MTEPSPQPSASATLVDVVPGRASAEVLVGALDAALRTLEAGGTVRVELDQGDSRRDIVAELYGADSRVLIAAPGAGIPAAAIRFEMPATARPELRTLSAIADLIRSEGLASVEVPVPVLVRRAGAGARLRAEATGTGSRRLRAAEVGLRSTGSRRPASPPPVGPLGSERAEHLRQRARGATMRARVDRNSHRLARERLQIRHERSRLRLAERRLAVTGTGEWVRWRSRNVARRVAGAPAVAASAASSVTAYGRRARRFATDRKRSRSAS